MDSVANLTDAIVEGSIERVRSLLNAGAHPNGNPGLGQWPLLTCLKYNQLEIAQLLIDKAADVNIRDSKGRTVLFHSIQLKNEEYFNMILNNGGVVNTSDEDGITPLHEAVSTRGDSFIKPLLENGANIDALSSLGETPLHLAIRSISPQSVQQLLVYKPNEKITQYSNLLPLALETIYYREKWYFEEMEEGFYYEKKEMSEIVDKLMNYGFSVSEELLKDDELLSRAVLLSNYRLLQELLQRGAPIQDGKYILENACSLGHIDIVELLLKHKVNLERGEYALEIAVEKDHLDVLKLLFQCDIPRRKNFLLYQAAKGGSTKVLQFLLENESPHFNVNSLFGGKTLLEISLVNNEAFIEMLWNFGADLNHRPEYTYENTPLSLACNGSDHYPLQALLRLGADVNQIEEIGREWTRTNFFIDGHSKCKVVREHIAALHTAGFYISEYCLSFMLEGGEDILAKYKQEIEIMKSIRLPNTNVTLYEILKCSENRMVQYVNNFDIIGALNSEEYLQKFPNYARLLETKIKVALRRRALVDEAVNTISFIGHFRRLPGSCIEYIISFLTTEELAIGVGHCRTREQIIIDDAFFLPMDTEIYDDDYFFVEDFDDESD